MRDSVTLLKATNAKLCKLFGPGYTPQKNWMPKRFSQEIREFQCFQELRDILEFISSQPDICIIRGILKQHEHGLYLRRGSNCTDMPHRWIMFDIEDENYDVTGWRNDTEGLINKVRRDKLPNTFHNTECYWQLSGSFPVKPGIRCHLFFLAESEIYSDDLKRFSNGLDVDRSVFSSTQIHFTSLPRFSGCLDPVMKNQRSGFITGRPYVEIQIPILKEEEKRPNPPRVHRPPYAGPSVIEEFKQQFTIQEILSLAGYKQVGDRFLHPHSSSMDPSTQS